jgi:hypothetical protein
MMIIENKPMIRVLTFFSYCNQTHEYTGGFLNEQVSAFLPDLMQPHTFCAGSDTKGYGSCEGDSGE